MRINTDKLIKVSVMGQVSHPVKGQDHVEPGVSVKNIERADSYTQGYNRAFNALACIGNEALIVSGDVKGEKGVVTGKHGGIEHILIDFPPETLERLVILLKMPLKEANGRLRIGVTHIIPAHIMGSGLGADDTHTGDYDIQLFDEETVKEYGLEDLRFGDFVAIQADALKLR